MTFDLSDYDFELPRELIADRPAVPRDSSRLLVVDRSAGRIETRVFRDLPGVLREGDLLVANRSRVIPARLLGRRMGGTGGKVEALLQRNLGDHRWEALVRASGRAAKGFRFEVGELSGEIERGLDESPDGVVVVRFDRDPLPFGLIPLPPYIERPTDARDVEDYQTVYAKESGSSAAPTAGLHFTEKVLAELRARGIGWEEIALHVGMGTFRPVRVADIRDHSIHVERYSVDAGAWARIAATREAGRRVIAVGTTATRTIESAARTEVLDGETSIYLLPGSSFLKTDGLLTNLHLPKSSLYILVCAFAGRELTREAYAVALRERFRFFSYGDAMLVV